MILAQRRHDGEILFARWSREERVISPKITTLHAADIELTEKLQLPECHSLGMSLQSDAIYQRQKVATSRLLRLAKLNVKCPGA